MSNLLTERNFITNGLSCLLMVVKIVLEAGILVFDFFLGGGGGGGVRGGGGYGAAHEKKSLSSSIFEWRTPTGIRILFS